MAKNSIRISAEVATIASHALSGRLDDAFVERLVHNLLCEIEVEQIVEDIMKSLAGSALSNRRA